MFKRISNLKKRVNYLYNRSWDAEISEWSYISNSLSSPEPTLKTLKYIINPHKIFLSLYPSPFPKLKLVNFSQFANSFPLQICNNLLNDIFALDTDLFSIVIIFRLLFFTVSINSVGNHFQSHEVDLSLVEDFRDWGAFHVHAFYLQMIDNLFLKIRNNIP